MTMWKFIHIAALGISLASSSSAQQAKAPGSGIAPHDIDEITAGGAPKAESDAAALAKKLQNPVASLISVPFQSNVDLGLGPNHDGVRYTLNIQPVIPFELNDDWKLISRTILPFIDQGEVLNATSSQMGLGDITQSFFFSPTKPGPGGIIWGAGPALYIPTATDGRLGAEKVGAGPTLVALRQDKGWTYGFLVNHIWSFAGNDNRADLDATFIQPFLAYTTKTATTFSVNLESSYDWNADQWTVPVNLQISQVIKLGHQLASIGLGGRYYADAPEGGPDWGFRLTLTLLFPEGH